MNVFLVITTDALCLNSSIPDYVFTTVSSFESDSFIFFYSDIHFLQTFDRQQSEHTLRLN